MPSAVIINDTRVDQHHGCKRVMAAIYELAARNGFEINGSAPAHRDWRTDATFVREFERADVVIVNGEGTIHHNRPAAIPLLEAGTHARKLGKRSVLLNFSWFANDSVMERALQDFDILSARESMSQDAVRKVRPDCRLVPDLSFCGSGAGSNERDGVGFGDSVNDSDSLALQRLRDRFRGWFVPIITPKPGLGGKLRLARYFLSNHGPTDQRSIKFRLAQAQDHLRNDIPDPDDYLSLLSRLRLLVTGRFHGVTLALCAGTPILAVSSNTRKIEALFSDVGLGAWRMIRPQEIDERLIEQGVIWHDSERENVRRYVAGAAEKAQALFRDLRALCAA